MTVKLKKNNLAKSTTVFLVVFLLAFSMLWVLEQQVPVLSSGQQSEDGIHGLTMLKDLTQESDLSLSFLLMGTGDAQLHLITAMIPTGSITFQNGLLPTQQSNSLNNYFHDIPIPSEAYEHTEHGWQVTIHLSEKSRQYASYLCVAPAQTGVLFLRLCDLGIAVVCGIYLLMTVYGLSLFLHKRGETYLLLFSLTAFVLLIWCLPSLLFSGTESKAISFLRLVMSSAYDAAIVLSVATCFSFCDVVPSKPFRWLCTPFSLFVLCILAIAIVGPLPGASATKEMVRFLIYSVGCVTVIIVCARSDYRPWLPLCGLAASQGMRMLALIPTASGAAGSFMILVVKMLRIFTLPYMFSYMFYINKKFSNKFTEAQNLAEQLSKNNQELDKIVEKRTNQLIEQQHMRISMTTNIFHDLRSPLYVMRGCMDEMQSTKAYDEESVQIIQERLRFITELVENLFLVSKLEDDTLLMETEPVQIRPILEKITAACRIQANQKGTDITLSAVQDAYAWGDEVWLSRAFQNLITNAVYYTPENGLPVQVTLQLTDHLICITIRDHGIGIAAEDLDKVFLRYFRAGARNKHTSSGLGLSIVHKVMERHNGKITVESEVGKGSVFTVTLPLWNYCENRE